ncbi:response regulator transcription factor [Actinomycetospora cinnamomea]|uniref:Regulatory LuxR family protein n=1 Tax=Actinomycetospora cinnamomea TaxID=663609 RepID=A0A2U1FFE3_9PSEU|nr:LuxR C-terminal-related transcriptional regulator [Actinomycetospora cinnamomea]PVZ10879.1 regulatory LuxR family protein [Actinomycetospora cinnamomea]
MVAERCAQRYQVLRWSGGNVGGQSEWLPAAARLYISPRTVQTHITHILRKLGLRSRAEVSANLSRRQTRQQLRGTATAARPCVRAPSTYPGARHRFDFASRARLGQRTLNSGRASRRCWSGDQNSLARAGRATE